MLRGWSGKLNPIPIFDGQHHDDLRRVPIFAKVKLDLQWGGCGDIKDTMELLSVYMCPFTLPMKSSIIPKRFPSVRQISLTCQ